MCKCIIFIIINLHVNVSVALCLQIAVSVQSKCDHSKFIICHCITVNYRWHHITILSVLNFMDNRFFCPVSRFIQLFFNRHNRCNPQETLTIPILFIICEFILRYNARIDDLLFFLFCIMLSPFLIFKIIIHIRHGAVRIYRIA